jgi:putative zinc finger/helix-turn-helix YgiT family protein
MSKNSRNGATRRCPVCGLGELGHRLISESYEHKCEDDVVTVQTHNIPLEDCPICGETFSGPEAARIRHDALGVAIGLMRPQEIHALRERFGMTSDEFSRLIGVSKDRLREWESGTSWQDRSVDRLLRLLEMNPENHGLLERIALGERGSPSAPATEVRTDITGRRRRSIIRPTQSEKG